ncbi:glycosyltransferase [Enterobacter cloacae]|nr:glycosyltransferase [Enterobacter cloacae]OZU92888.1 glycosyl transferase [Enterobacter cloacae]PAN84974.1 glycosyl transferase [Enterobacter cloacae]PAN97351.1 glycosyl transferase [Enterobacter cloacae]HAS1027094.1 glycosyltransferase [Enterobacter cloacae]HAS1035969.1 glycosyltransferase [Enterobacter cloacae]
MAGKLAVIMSIYKSDDPEALRVALDSLINQTYPCDIFVYQDGEIPLALTSVIQDYVDNCQIKLTFCPVNKGLAHGLNTLINEVLQGDYIYIARMDSDDISRPKRLSEQVSYLEKNPQVDICGTFCQEFGSTYALTEKRLPKAHEDLVKFSIARCPFIHPTVMFRRRVFEKGHRYPTHTTYTEDMALWFALINAGFKLGNVDKVLLDYRLTEDTILRRRGFKKSISEVKLRVKYMMLLKMLTLKNVMLITSRVIFHLLPVSFMRFMYRNMR